MYDFYCFINPYIQSATKKNKKKNSELIHVRSSKSWSRHAGSFINNKFLVFCPLNELMGKQYAHFWFFFYMLY